MRLISVLMLVVSTLPISLFGQETASTIVEIVSGGSVMQGRFFAADGEGHPTLLLIPGWPGNQQDVLGMGSRLIQYGLNVLMVNPRGMHQSQGVMTFANTMDDIQAAFEWLRDPDVGRRYSIDTSLVAIGGHSFGGGMALAYAARDGRVRRVISLAGNDHGEFIREYQRNAAFAHSIDEMLRSTLAPIGPVRFDPALVMRELAEHQGIYGLRENAENLADRSILIAGGWEDRQATIEQFLLPFYRALRLAGAEDVTFVVYHDNHSFGQVRDRVAAEINDWLMQHVAR